jgi:transcriptional regulator with XRE-family HTH domain
MKEIFLGEVIRRRRIELGLTQEALCEGICEPMTISRFENGRQTPSRNHVKALLFRLGLPDDRFFGLLSQREIEIEALQQEITNCHVLLQHSKTEQRCAIREDLLQKHQALRTLISPEDRLLQQFLLRSKYLMGTENDPYGLNKGMSLLTEAMRLTNPHFDLEHIGQSLYTSQEIKLINNMANCYMRANRHTEAIHILQQLLEYVQSHLSKLSYEKSHIQLCIGIKACRTVCGGNQNCRVWSNHLRTMRCLSIVARSPCCFGRVLFFPGRKREKRRFVQAGFLHIQSFRKYH